MMELTIPIESAADIQSVVSTLLGPFLRDETMVEILPDGSVRLSKDTGFGIASATFSVTPLDCTDAGKL